MKTKAKTRIVQVPSRWLIGISGSVNAGVVPQHISVLKGMGIDVRVIMSTNADRFVTVTAIQAMSGHQVFRTVFDSGDGVQIPHVELPALADIIVVMPASFDVIGKVAGGIADDLLSAAIANATTPVVFVPAMNPIMWKKPALQRNVSTLRMDGYYVMDPGSGLSAKTSMQINTTMPQLEAIMEFVSRVSTTEATHLA